MKVNIELLPYGQMPTKAHVDDAGFDLYAANEETIHLWAGDTKLIPVGFKINLPPGWEAQIRPRSGLAFRQSVTVLNAPGTIDAGYRGEVGVILVNHSKSKQFTVNKGDRIAQMVIKPVPKIELVVGSVDETARGAAGYGSSGK